MRASLVFLVCLVVAGGAEAGDNPGVNIFLEFENGENYIEPLPDEVITVTVYIESLGPGSGTTGVELRLERTFAGAWISSSALPPGWTEIGDPVTGWQIVGPCVMPDGSGRVAVGEVTYIVDGSPGTLEILEWNERHVSDCAFQLDEWCVRSSPSGNAGVWQFPPPGDCVDPVAPESGWPHDPQLNRPLCVAAHDQTFPKLASDGTGGAIITWRDSRDSEGDVYAQRVDASGAIQWTVDGEAICSAADWQFSQKIISDGAGGAIIVWSDYRDGGYDESDIYAQRVDASGAVQWTADGEAICHVTGRQFAPQIVSDGAGGAIIAWADSRTAMSEWIYVHRVSASGVLQWGGSGVQLAVTSGPQSGPQLISDGSGGAIAVWVDDEEDVFAQRVDASGVVQWGAGGVQIYPYYGTEELPRLVTDGDGGAIIAWVDDRYGTRDIYAQRVGATGTLEWQDAGVYVCVADNEQRYPQIVSDGAGGAIVAWVDERSAEGEQDVYAQRVDADGFMQWTENGVPVCSDGSVQSWAQLTPDGVGGAIITWEDGRGGFLRRDIYAQRVEPSGAMRWTTDGVPVSTAAEAQYYPELVSDGAGGAIIAWIDARNNPPATDVYAQRVERNGYLGLPSAVITEVADIRRDQGGVVEMNWAPSYLDAYPENVVTHYSVWRRMPEGQLHRNAGTSLLWQHVGDAGASSGWADALARSAWVHVEDVPAYYLDEYACYAPTYGDSTEFEIPMTEYMVVAATEDPWVFWESPVASGYSVDNLSPGAPRSLAAEPASIDVELTWQPSGEHDEDLSVYNVYRGDESGFILDETTFVVATADTSFVDQGPGGGTWYYRVAAEDVHGNEGPPSNEAEAQVWTNIEDPDSELPLAFALRGSQPNPFTGLTRVAFDVPADGGDVRLEVFDVSGRLVRVLIEGHESAGRKLVSWDGADTSGRRVASGVYYCRMTAGAYEETIKMTLIK